MIVLEERLSEIFDTLPPIVNSGGSFKPTFGFGDDLELNKFIKARIKERIHPLVWLVYGNIEMHDKHDKYLVSNSTTLIIACKSLDHPLNEQRLKTTYSTILNPMLDNVKKALISSGITKVTPIRDKLFFEISKHPNYTSENIQTDAKTIVIWDAIKLTFNLEVNDCTFTSTISY